jgi:hypothetical protein
LIAKKQAKMESLIALRNQTIIFTLALGIAGFTGLLFFNLINALSFLTGAIISTAYIWHLSVNADKIGIYKKSANSIIRIILAMVLIIIAVKVFSLNFIFLIPGFLCNHLALFGLVVRQLVRDRKTESCK